MRRITCVRIVVADAGARAEVVGISHRIPIVRAVPLRVATALVAAGVPSVIRRS